MANRINNFGLQDVPINTVRDDKQNAYILIDFAGLTYDQAMDLVGHPGQFEMRIQSSGNESEHILYGDAVSSSGVISDTSTGQASYSVNFLLTQEGARRSTRSPASMTS
jgi:preprotein translocase subunit SecD